MCGICGFIAAPGPDDPKAVLKRMMAPLAARGPDEEGFYYHKDPTGIFALGARRLAIIDIESGKQPMESVSGDVVVAQNGEIYNYMDLRRGLAQNRTFRTGSDTETLLHLYEEEGKDLFTRINGMFAVAIYDRRKKKLILARDRVGKKPLYYWLGSHAFCFSSELNSLLHYPGIPRVLNPDAVASLFSFLCIPAPMTIYRGVHKLEPGHTLEVGIDRFVKRRYWSVPEPGSTDGLRDFHNHFRDLFLDAVSIRLKSDVPLGVLLSGGMDSAAVLSGATRFRGGIPSFTASFSEASFDETAYARHASRHAGSPHFTRKVAADLRRQIPTLMERFGEPFGDSSFFPTHQICAMASEKVKVVLTGDGADELFGGYRKNRAARILDSVCRLPVPLLNLAKKGGIFHPDAARLLKAVDQPFYENYVEWESGTPFLALRYFFEEDFLKDVSMVPQEIFENMATGRNHLERSLSVDANLYLANDLLPKMDMASMACSIEARSPFLDYRIVELVAGLPARMRASLFRSKRMMGNLLGDLIPRRIRKRAKHGFTVPLRHWLCDLLRDPEHSPFLSTAFQLRGIYHRNRIDALVGEFLNKENAPLWQTNLVWNLYLLETWFQGVSIERDSKIAS